jgi:hypothetical protein
MTTTENAKPPIADRPPIPRPARPSLLTRFYTLAGGGVIAVYLGAGLLGWDFRSTARETVPASVRTAPGGYRTFHFWHTGYHGGK